MSLLHELEFAFKACVLGEGEPTHKLVPCYMIATLPPRNQCTGCFAPAMCLGSTSLLSLCGSIVVFLLLFETFWHGRAWVLHYLV